MLQTSKTISVRVWMKTQHPRTPIAQFTSRENTRERNHPKLYWTVARKCTWGDQKSRQTLCERDFGDVFAQMFCTEPQKGCVHRYSTASCFEMFPLWARLRHLIILVLLHLSVPKSGIQCPLIVMSPHLHYTKLDLQEQSDCLKPNEDEKHCVLLWSHCVSM